MRKYTKEQLRLINNRRTTEVIRCVLAHNGMSSRISAAKHQAMTAQVRLIRMKYAEVYKQLRSA